MRLLIAVCVLSVLKLSLQKLKSHPPLVTLGTSLAVRIQNHTCQDAEVLLKDTHKYLTMLKDLYNMILSKAREDVNKGMAMLNTVEEYGGPSHTNIDIDYNVLKEKYLWNDKNSIDDFKAVMKDTKQLWRNMKERANHLRNGIPDPETEEDGAAGIESSEGELH